MYCNLFSLASSCNFDSFSPKLKFRAMKNQNLKPYNATLATLSIGCCKILDLGLAESLLDQINEGLSKYTYAFNALLYACDVTVIYLS